MKQLFSPVEKHGKPPAVLLIHGFGGSPHDLRPLIDVLQEKNIAFSAILLSGHGTAPEDMQQIKEGQWNKEVQDAFDAIYEKYKRVYVVGFSMGGAIAVELATKRFVEKLVLISPCFKVRTKWYYLRSPEWWVEKIKRFIPFVRKLKKGQIHNPHGLAVYFAYDYLLLESIALLVHIGKQSALLAPHITVPLLVLHSEKDNVADFKRSYEVFQQIASENKRFVRYTKSNHILLYDYDMNDALRQIEDFLIGDTRAQAITK